MKKAYTKPELMLLRLEVEDILSSNNSLPFAPFIIDDNMNGVHDDDEIVTY